MNPEKERLRARLRARRRGLAPETRRAAAASWYRQLRAWSAFRAARAVAFYLPHNGEMDIRPALEHALALGKHGYLPVLRGNALVFARYQKRTPMRANRFGIPEPLATEIVPAAHLDMILTPLVGFTCEGRRLGMGGGYYDATLAFLRTRPRWRRPLVVGAAYAFQELEELPAEDWDVPLHAVITERGVIETST
jgi:5-formyltetrahydrofolate cyclo-ligase